MVVLRVLLILLICVSVTFGQLEIGVKKKHKTKKGFVARDAGSTKTSTNTSDGYTEKMQAFQNLEYKGTVSVGNPPQVFEVIMDTGSDVFWLPRVGCQSSGPDVSSCLSGQGLYDPSKSSTAVDLHERFQIQYGTGSATGQYFSEQMSFGDATGNHVDVGNVTFGAATRMTFSDEGILGLSFAQKGDPTPIFELAVQRGVFSQPVFSVYLADCDGDECENGGIIKFGGADIEHCSSVVGTAQVVGSTPYWLFDLSGISVGGRALRIQNSMKAIVDTGTSIIAGPTQVIQQIATAFGAQKTQDTYLVPCNSQIQVEFQISGQTYTVTSTELILAGTVASDGRQSYCQLAIDGDNSLDFIILGSPFIRAYCLIHNIKEKSISFAPVKNKSQPNTNTATIPSNGSGGKGSGGRGNHCPFCNTNGNSPYSSGSDPFGFGNSPFASSSPFGSSPFGQSNNWPFGQSGNDPFGSGNSPFASSSSSGWPYSNKNPFGTSSNFPLSSSWSFPDSSFWFYERPYYKK